MKKAEKVPHINLMICTPGHSVMKNYLDSLIKTFSLLQREGITFGFANEYSSLVHNAREVTLSGTNNNFLDDSRPFSAKLTYDKIMWIDSDMMWDAEDVVKLYKAEEDIITGVYLFTNGTTSAHKEQLSQPMRFEDLKGATEKMKIGATGFGFLMIKQGVFEKLTRPWFQPVFRDMDFDDGITRNVPIMGEDVAWCVRVGEVGFDIWLDPSVKVTHNKTVRLTWEGMQP